MVIRSLLTRLGFEVNTGPAKKYNRTIFVLKNNTINFNKAVRKTRRPMRRFNVRLMTTSKNARRASRFLFGMTSTLGAFSKNLGFANLGVVTIGAGILNLGGQAEQTRIAFEVLTGSVEEGKKLYKDMIEFAKKTPFSVAGVQESAKRFLAFGFTAKEIIPTLRDMGNIASGVGTGKLRQLTKALGDVKTKGKLAGYEVRQFNEAGVKIQAALAKHLGRSVQEIDSLVTKGKISFKDVAEALRKLSRTRFGKLMARQNRTLLGQFEELSEVAKNIAREIGEALGPAFKEVIIVIRKYITANREVIKSNTIKFFKNFAIVVLGIALTFFRLIQRVGGVSGIIETVSKKFKSLSKFIKENQTLFKGLLAILLIMAALAFTGIAFKNIIGFITFLAKNPQILKFLAGLAGISTAIFFVAKNFDTLKKKTNDFLDFMAASFNQKVTPIFKRIEDFISRVENFLNGAGGKVLKFFGVDMSASAPPLARGGQNQQSMLSSMPKTALRSERITQQNQVTVNPEIKVTMPNGTTGQQVKSFTDQLKSSLNPILNGILQKTINDLRPTEAQ